MQRPSASTEKAAQPARGAADTRPLWRVFLAFLWPMVLANVLQSLSGTWSAVVYGGAAALSGVMRASGTVLVPTAISIACIVLVELPAAYGLSGPFGLAGVWMSYPIAFCAMLALQTAYYRLVWRKMQIERLV